MFANSSSVEDSKRDARIPMRFLFRGVNLFGATLNMFPGDSVTGVF